MARGAKHSEVNKSGISKGIPMESASSQMIHSDHITSEGFRAGTEASKTKDNPRGEAARVPVEKILKMFAAIEKKPLDKFSNNPELIEMLDQELAHLEQKSLEGKFLKGLRDMLKTKDADIYSKLMDYIVKENPNDATQIVGNQQDKQEEQAQIDSLEGSGEPMIENGPMGMEDGQQEPEQGNVPLAKFGKRIGNKLDYNNLNMNRNNYYGNQQYQMGGQMPEDMGGMDEAMMEDPMAAAMATQGGGMEGMEDPMMGGGMEEMGGMEQGMEGMESGGAEAGYELATQVIEIMPEIFRPMDEEELMSNPQDIFADEFKDELVDMGIPIEEIESTTFETLADGNIGQVLTEIVMEADGEGMDQMEGGEGMEQMEPGMEQGMEPGMDMMDSDMDMMEGLEQGMGQDMGMDQEMMAQYGGRYDSYNSSQMYQNGGRTRFQNSGETDEDFAIRRAENDANRAAYLNKKKMFGPDYKGDFDKSNTVTPEMTAMAENYRRDNNLPGNVADVTASDPRIGSSSYAEYRIDPSEVNANRPNYKGHNVESNVLREILPFKDSEPTETVVLPPHETEGRRKYLYELAEKAGVATSGLSNFFPKKLTEVYPEYFSKWNAPDVKSTKSPFSDAGLQRLIEQGYSKDELEAITFENIGQSNVYKNLLAGDMSNRINAYAKKGMGFVTESGAGRDLDPTPSDLHFRNLEALRGGGFPEESVSRPYLNLLKRAAALPGVVDAATLRSAMTGDPEDRKIVEKYEADKYRKGRVEDVRREKSYGYSDGEAPVNKPIPDDFGIGENGEILSFQQAFARAQQFEGLEKFNYLGHSKSNKRESQIPLNQREAFRGEGKIYKPAIDRKPSSTIQDNTGLFKDRALVPMGSSDRVPHSYGGRPAYRNGQYVKFQQGGRTREGFISNYNPRTGDFSLIDN